MASHSDTSSVFTQVSPAVLIERRGNTFAFVRWTLSNFAALGRLAKQQTPWVQVGKHDCRLLLYPGGDTQALPGYVSLYLQVSDPRSGTGRWDCFASYRLSIVNQAEVSKSIVRDSWHRFSAKKKSHGWCDFGPSSTVLDAKQGFLQDETLLVTADVQTLQESISFARDGELSGGSNLAGVGTGEVLGGKYTWKLHNFRMFRETIRTQKIMSPSFPAGECSLRLCLYQSVVSGTDHLSICLESKDTEKSGTVERSCWCLFRLVLVAEGPGSQPLYRDSYGRFAADSKTGDNTSLGWNDFITMDEFSDPANGYIQDDTVTLTATFNVINESSSFGRSLEKGLPAGKARLKAKATTGDVFEGKFSWKVEQFTKLKDLLKKRKITGLCIKSKRFIVGGRDCRLIVYPRGQSNPPNHLSMFLEVSDSRAGLGEDWSCFVSHKLAVMHHRGDRDRSASKESQNRYSRAAKDWGWREFLTLTTLFDADSGFLVNDAVEFAAEVLVLRESSETRHLPPDDMPEGLSTGGQPLVSLGPDTISTATKVRFLWRIENFTSFRDIMETRKIFSKYFEAGSCDLRLGMYESFDTMCIYLESDAPAGPDHNFWVKYRIAVLNQKRPDRTVWKDSAICTKQWNNSVLQFMKVSDILDPEAGFVHKEGLSISCEVLEACPWFEFADLDVCVNSEDEDAGFSTDLDEILDSDEEAALAGERDEELHRLLAKAGMQLSRAPGSDAAVLLDTSALQHALLDQQMLDRSVLTAFLGGLQVYLKDPVKIKRLLLPTVTPVETRYRGQAQKGSRNGGQRPHHATSAGLYQPSSAASAGSRISSSAHKGGIMCLLDLLMSVRALRYPLLELLLDVMLVCCQQLIVLETHALAEDFDDGSESSPVGSWGSPNAAAAGTEEGPVAAMLDSGSSSKAQAQPQEQADGAAAAATEAGAQLDRHVSDCTSSSGQRAGMMLSQLPSFAGLPISANGLAGASSSSSEGSSSAEAESQLIKARLHSSGAETAAGSSSAAAMRPTPVVVRVISSSSQETGSRGPAAQQQQGADRGAHRDSERLAVPAAAPGRAELEDVLTLAVTWMRKADPFLFPTAASHGKPHGGIGKPPAAHKLGLLLSAIPVHQQPDMIMLLPKLLEPADHVLAATLLVQRMVELQARGAEAEALLRLPVLATLALLSVEGDAAKAVVAAALQMLPSMPHTELPPAVGLTLRLASNAPPEAQLQAVQAVRASLRALPPSALPSASEALRLAVSQYEAVAQATLEAITADLLHSKDVKGKASAEQPGPLGMADLDVLLDLLCSQHLQNAAQSLLELAATKRLVDVSMMGLVLERRRMQHLVASQMPGPASEGATASGTGSSLAAAWGLTAATAASLASTGSPAASPRTPDLAPGSARAVPGSSMTSLASNEGATAMATTALRGAMPAAIDAGEQAGADRPELAKEAPWQAASGAEVRQGISAEAKAGDLTSSSPRPPQQHPPPLHTGAGPPMSFPALSPVAGSPALRPSQTDELLQPPAERYAERDAGGIGSSEGAPAGGPSGAGGAGLPPVTSASLEGLAAGYNILLERDFLALLSLAEMLGRSQVLQVRELTAWLYSTMFRVYEDASSRERMLLSLVQQAVAMPASGKPSHNLAAQGNAGCEGEANSGKAGATANRGQAGALAHLGKGKAARRSSSRSLDQHQRAGSVSRAAEPVVTSSAGAGGNSKGAKARARSRARAASRSSSMADLAGASVSESLPLSREGSSTLPPLHGAASSGAAQEAAGSAAAEAAGSSSEQAAGDSAASQTLLHIVGQHGHMGPTAVALMLQQLGAQQAWAGALQQQVDALEAAQQQRSSAEQGELAAAQAETETLRGRIAGLEDQLAQVQAVRKADSQGHQSGRKELQDRVRNLEKELDWVGAELSDARKGAQRAAREATGRVREAEEGASRARAARREDAKRVAKERSQMAERLKESESAVQRLELEAAGLQASAAAANERAELATAGSAKQLQEAQTAARLQQSEVSRCRAYIESLETKLAGQQEYVSGLEGRLQADLARVAPLLGQGLDDLSAAQLSSLVRVHEDGARRARAMLANRQQEEGAEAVATAAAHAVTGPATAESPEHAASSVIKLRTSLGSSVESLGSALSGSTEGGASDGRASRSATQSPAPLGLFPSPMHHHQQPAFGNGSLPLGSASASSMGFSALASLGNGTFSSGAMSSSGLHLGSSGAKQSQLPNGQHRLW